MIKMWKYLLLLINTMWISKNVFKAKQPKSRNIKYFPFRTIVDKFVDSFTSFVDVNLPKNGKIFLWEVVSMYKRINEAVLADIAEKMNALAAEISVKEVPYEKQVQILKTVQTELKEILALHCTEAEE